MRIAFDLDGVLADLHEPFVQAAIRLFPELDAATIGAADIGASPPTSREKPPRKPELPAAAPVALTQPAVGRGVEAPRRRPRTSGRRSRRSRSGAIARLAELADERGWEVLFITSRPQVGRPDRAAAEPALAPAPRLSDCRACYVVHGSRGRVAEALRLDVVIDDRPDNCLDVVLESKAGAILVWRGSESSVPASARRMGIGVVSTVDAALSPWSRPSAAPRRAAGWSIAFVVSSASRLAPRRTAAADTAPHRLCSQAFSVLAMLPWLYPPAISTRPSRSVVADEKNRGSSSDPLATPKRPDKGS